MADKNNEKQFSRRDFLKTTGAATGGIIGGSLLGGLVGFRMDGSNAPADEAPTDTASETESGGEESVEARTFFSRSEDFRTLAAAVERIYPEDDNGPGAVALGVPYFIDRQLYGFWGSNSNDYKKGPFDPSRTSTHGLQERMNRGEIFLAGVRKLQEISLDEHTEEFPALDGGQQDDILRQFEAGEVEIKGTSSSTFFSLLRRTTIEGVYADPAYGGNKDMQGWEMIKYPGPRMGWMEEIESEEFQELEPKSLRAYQGGGV
ncbi:gluconate 2-dehydrogenase subunit 3 family protein [Corticicoccus populi]|uniref:Gluconate 2-dehydrogenase subunit 3 family protein n=1 Tax=Corticicoccus populi TaxID=1812821 RepID=A0ABW5WTG1_9STAP